MIDEDGFDSRWLGKSIPLRHWHFHRRLFDHYGIVLAPGEFSQMLKDISSGRAVLLQRKSARKAIYMVRNSRLWERYFVVVKDNQVVTALPPSRTLKRLRRLSSS